MIFALLLVSSSTSHRLLVYNRVSSGWQNRQLTRLISPCLKPGALRLISGKCPVLDNSRGLGYKGIAGIFVYAEGCPVHQEDISKKLAEGK